MKDIAAACGVSKTTVSRYINDSGYVSSDVADRIEKAIKKMDYVPSASARSLSTRKSNVVGVVVPEANNTFFSEAFKGISHIADENDLSIIYFNTDNDDKKELKALINLRKYDICGLIITPSKGGINDKEYIEQFSNAVKSLKVPVVLFDRDLPETNFFGVFSDNYQGSYKAAKLLIDNGHKTIAAITGDRSLQLGELRYNGFVQAAKDAGIEKENIIILEGDFTTETAYVNAKKLTKMVNRPTAVFSANNMTTIGILKAFYEEGIKIPEDIALVGFDDIKMLNDLHIPITSLKRNAAAMGAKSMELLYDLIADEDVMQSDIKSKKIVIDGELIKRGSEKRG